MSNAEQFIRDVTIHLGDQIDDARDGVRSAALEALSGVVLKTPVDTGRARGNWLVSVGQVDESVSDTTDVSGQAAISAGGAAIAAYPDSGFPVIYIQNSLPYIEAVENGSSKQAPSGMVAVTLAELSNEL